MNRLRAFTRFSKFHIAQGQKKRLLRIAAATPLIVIAVSLLSGINFFSLKEMSAANIEGSAPVARDCQGSPELRLPAGLSGDQPLRVRDGEHKIGEFRVREGLLEVKVIVEKARRTQPFLTLNGRRLGDYSGQIPRESEECAKSHGLATVQRPGILERAVALLAPTAYAVDCSHCTYFKITRDCNETSCIYVLWGRCGGTWVRCSTSKGPPLAS
jgi:hypothetical protein